MAGITLGIGASLGSMLPSPPEEWNGRARADRKNPALAYRGHAYGFVYRRLRADKPVPLVPILVNTFYPPNQP